MRRASTILGFLAVVCLASVVHADTVTCAAYSGTGPYPGSGSSGAVTINSTVTAYCGNTIGSTANAPALFAAAGTYLDTINWGANPSPDSSCSSGSAYCYDPDYWNSDGQGDQAPEPPYGGGVNGTGYSIGQSSPVYTDGTGGTLLTTPSFLTVPNAVGPLTNLSQNNILTTNESGFQGLGLTFDTSTTDCTVSGCPDPIYPYSSVYGVGFNVELGGNTGDSTVQADSYTVTFDIYAATPGCTETIDNLVYDPPTIDCFDYQTGVPTTADGSTDLSGSVLNAALLAAVTVNSSDGSAGFFAVQSSVAIGAIYAIPGSDSAVYGELGAGAFGIGAVTLNDQPSGDTPEPATLLLFGSGLLMVARRLRKNMATK